MIESSRRATSGSGKAISWVMILREMSSVVGRKGRMSTRERSGTRVGPMRLAWTGGELVWVIFFPPGSNQRWLFSQWFLKSGERILDRLHFRKRQEIGESRFGALVLTQTVHMQAVATTAISGIVKGQPEIVAAEKPLESAARFREPKWIVGRLVGLDTCGDGSLRFNGLLIEKGSFFS